MSTNLLWIVARQVNPEDQFLLIAYSSSSVYKNMNFEHNALQILSKFRFVSVLGKNKREGYLH